MKKIGYLSMIAGILAIVGYVLHSVLVSLDVSLFMKISIMLVVLGAIIVIIKQIFDRKKEKKEEEDYKDY